MAPGQNTFTIIPNAPGIINGDPDAAQALPSHRPMTIKQAKKAYQKANKGPKLSKAEQRRRDLLEQDRIRKEFEKEKNQARAKATRDRKREKEEKERAEKKKKGLPLVDVHPSQDTIAWFVRGNGRKKKEGLVPNLPAVSKDESGSCTVSGEESESEPPLKRQKTASPVPDNSAPTHSPSAAGMNADSMSAAYGVEARVREDTPGIDGAAEEHPMPEQEDNQVDDSETIETLPDELFAELIDTTNSQHIDDSVVLDKESSTRKTSNSPPPSIPPPIPSSVPSETRRHSPVPIKEELSEQKAEDSASLPSVQQPLQPLTENDETKAKDVGPSKETPFQKEEPVVLMRPPILRSPAQASEKPQPTFSASRSFRHPKTPMGPPPVPPKFKSRANASIGSPKAPPFLLKQTSPKFVSATKPKPQTAGGYVLPAAQEDYPPTSTQLFMLGHLDDFFPSPSQEVRELFGDSKPNGETTSHIPKVKTKYQNRPPENKFLSSKSIPTPPSLNQPKPPMNEKKPKAAPFRGSISPAQMRKLSPPQVPTVQSSGNSEAFDMPFFSTQDLFLSSQDIEDLEDKTESRLGFVNDDSNRQSEIYGHNSPLPTTTKSETKSETKSDVNIGLKDPIALPPVNKFNGSSVSSRRPSSGNGPQAYPRPTNTSGKHINSSASVTQKVASSNTQIKKTPIDHSFKNQTRPPEKSESRTSQVISNDPPTRTPNAIPVKNVAPPHNSPKPFFANSGREAHIKYTIERAKNSAWEGASIRRKVQEELESLQRLEDERLNELLLERMVEDEDIQDIETSPYGLGSIPENSTPRPYNQTKAQSQPRSINQLSGSVARNIQTQKKDESKEKRVPRGRSRSSYEEMLALAERRENQRKEQQQDIVASQETDYGDAGFDDVFNEIL
ncbi:hypothetical protein M426DRAFT_317415 [Hypoxylon sp. CI-4A]|nr:hypothetical protein M426DRAFT_317415 [Hypoxylon sp. CI-4A]